MRKAITILDALASPKLLGRVLDFDHEFWAAWRAALAAMFALPMSPEQMAIFRECTGRTDPPTHPCDEFWAVCGRRSGKSRVLALVAVFLACFHDYSRHLSVGERGVVMVVASNRRQARVIFDYIRKAIHAVPTLKAMVEREDKETLDLDNGLSIEVQTCSIASVRGYTVVAALLDEVAFWANEDSANPDEDVIAALRPAMSTIPNAMLLVASSPYSRRGALWSTWRRYHGKDGPVMVWHAASKKMNSTIPDRVIERAFERDPIAAAAEWNAQFRADIAAFVAREAVDACVSDGVRERPRQPGQSYFGFVDPSGGSADAFTLAISHRDKDGVAVLDLIRERRPPFSPEAVVKSFCDDLKRYGIRKVTGDRYAGEFAREPFRKRGISYELSEKTKSEIYIGALASINSGKVDLLDEPKLIAQICGLERRTARGGKDSVDHGPGAHDDLANSALGALLLCERKFSGYTAGLMSDPSLAPGYVGATLINPRERAANYVHALARGHGLYRY